MKLPLGIDVSSQTLDYDFTNNQGIEDRGRVLNIEQNIIDFLTVYDPQKVFFVVEPTGTYSDKFFNLAHRYGFEIRIADPNKSSQFMNLLGLIRKNDSNAARALTLMGRSKELTLPRYVPQSELMKERKQIVMTLNGLAKQCNMLSNQIHAMEQKLSPSQTALNALKNALKALDEQKQLLEEEILELDDEEADHFIQFATSVKGIGPKSANLLLMYTNGLTTFEKKSQLVKFVGTVNSSHQSGSSINRKRGITKNGPSLLRSCLYNAAKSAKRYNNACKAIYERLRAKGKPHKVAMIAVINKLLKQVFAVVKLKTPFDNQRYLNNSY